MRATFSPWATTTGVPPAADQPLTLPGKGARLAVGRGASALVRATGGVLYVVTPGRSGASGWLYTGETGAALATEPVGARSAAVDENGFEKGSENLVTSDEQPPRSAAARPATIILTALRGVTDTLDLLIATPTQLI